MVRARAEGDAIQSRFLIGINLLEKREKGM
jgi:hypothetical protein